MKQLLQQIEDYKKEIESIVPNGAESLEAYRIKFLGTKGIVKNLFGEMRNVPNEKKKEFGQILNEFKQFAETKYEEGKESAVGSQESVANNFDLSLPGDSLPLGARHPISLVRNQIIH